MPDPIPLLTPGSARATAAYDRTMVTRLHILFDIIAQIAPGRDSTFEEFCNACYLTYKADQNATFWPPASESLAQRKAEFLGLATSDIDKAAAIAEAKHRELYDAYMDGTLLRIAEGKQ